MRLVETARISMPALGLGTFRLEDRHAQRMIERALAEGYRHIDTAQMYGNEAAIGRGIAGAGIPREDLFVTTKVWPDRFHRPEFDRAVEESLRDLGTDYIDLLLLHWPSREVPVAETLEGMAEAVEQERVRHAGVSNFTRALFEEAERHSAVPIAVDQVECHPYLDQRPLRRFLAGRDAVMTAYCPLALGRVMEDRVIERIAVARDTTVGQVTLAWILSAPNTAVIPKTASSDRLAENLAATEIELTSDEIAAIDELARPDGRIIDPPDVAPAWD